jgi:small subunit ribosomal protein S20
MANTKSAAKAAKQAIKRNAINSSRKGKVKAAIKALLESISKKDVKAAQTNLVVAQQQLFKAVSKGTYKLETVSRKFSRLNKAVKTLAGK